MSSPQVKFVLDAAWRRKWLLVLPPLLGLTVGWAVVQRTDKLYTSSTLIFIEGQRVPEKILTTTVTARIDERLNRLQELVKSPSYLEQVARGIGMLSDNPTNEEIEAARAKLRGRITFDPDLKNFQWFKVSVTDEHPKAAAKAANLVADLFIAENQKMRQQFARSAEGIVAGMLEEREAELREAERRLAEFRRAHLGELPTDQTSNQTQIGTYSQQIEYLTEQIRTRQDEIDTYQDRIDTTETIASIVGEPSGTSDPLLRQLQTARETLDQLRRKYSDEHPDVRSQRAEVDRLERQYQEQLDRELRAAPSDPSASSAQVVTPRSPAEARIAFLRGEIRDLERQRADLQARVNVLLARVRNAPLVEVEYNELLRAFNEARAAYESVRGRREGAAQGVELEEAGLGEQFRVQDRARPSWTPSYPNVPSFLFGGAALGLLLGLGIAFLLEQLDPSLRTEERFRHAFPDLPLLESIPSLGPDPMIAKGRKGKGGKGMKPGKGKAAAAVAVAIVTGGLFA